MENMIDVTGIDLVKAVQEAYALSSPQGMGILHYKEGPLSAEEAKELIHEDGRLAVSLDYVKGRSCKFNVIRKDDKLFIRKSWYDHSESQLTELLKRLGISQAP